MGKELPAYAIRIANTPEDIQRCMQIRKEVFIDEQGYDIKVETNDDDHRSTHFLLVLNETDEAVGTIRLINENNQLGRFAILKQYRGQGLGVPLIEALHGHVREQGGKEVWCQSQAADPRQGGVDATGFYKRLGYVNKGEKYMKEGTVHQDMVYTIPNVTPLPSGHPHLMYSGSTALFVDMHALQPLEKFQNPTIEPLYTGWGCPHAQTD